MKVLVCIIGWVVAGFLGLTMYGAAQSAIHQILGSVFFLISALFLLTALLIDAINDSANSTETKLNKAIELLADRLYEARKSQSAGEAISDRWVINEKT